MAVSVGDAAGIGLDIILAALARSRRDGVPLPRFVVYGDEAALAARAEVLGMPVEIVSVARPHEVAADAAAGALRLHVVPVPLAVVVSPGRPDTANAPATIQAIERAVADVAAGAAAGIVTCPIAKNVLQAAGFPHPGHTEFLGILAERHYPGATRRPVMMLAAAELRVVPVTVHIPLADVPRALTRELLRDAIETTAAALASDFGLTTPRIAVTGLNPHAGESGTMGREDAETIAPVVAEFAARGLAITGPHPADTLFHAAARSRYDAAIAMYHDQALIPLKTLAFDSGVNITLGLPFVRTSPDHGTAFDIAGSGKANPESFIAALRMAADMAARRRARGGLPA